MEAAGSSRNVDTYLIYNRPNNPENNNLHNYRRENLSNLTLALKCVVMLLPKSFQYRHYCNVPAINEKLKPILTCHFPYRS